MKKTDEKLELVYNYIKKYQIENGYPPSYREISLATDIKSTNSVKDYVDKLKSKGLIATSNSKNRSIKLLEEETLTDLANVSIPLIGQVAAGIPILAEQNVEEEFSFSSNLFGGQEKLFMLRIKGDSMIKIGINNGDLVVVKPHKTAENGELVVAMIENEATVKNIYFEKDKIRLQPQNDAYSPIYATEVTIIGKVVGLIKLFK